MKSFFAQRALYISLVIVISVTSSVYSQKIEKGGAGSLNKDMLLGKWKAESEEYTFDKSGTTVTMTNGRECPGTWIIEGNTLTINPRKLKWRKDDPCSKTKVFQIVEVGAEKLILTEKEAKNKLCFTKQK